MPYQKQVWPDATKQDSLGAKLNHIEQGVYGSAVVGDAAAVTANAAAQNFKVTDVAPTATKAGEMWFDTVTQTMRVWNGSAWRMAVYPAAASSATQGGSILQVVFASTSTQVNTTNTTIPQTVAIGLQASITPRATTNRILVQLAIQVRTIGSGSGAGIRVLRNGVAVSGGDAQNYALGYTNAAQTPSGRYPWVSLDSPATTSACTYIVYGGSYAATGVDFQDDSQYQSMMTLYEIAG